MSTPCIITAKENPTVAVYLHWDGYNKQMVQDIVNIAKKNNARNPNEDEQYGIARLVCACEEYFKNKTTGFGVGTINSFSYDFHYVVDENWQVSEKFQRS